jgi:uncharacterized coiled-coil protein SlyX
MLPLADITLSAESIAAAVAVVSGLSAWMILPRRVDALEVRLAKLEQDQAAAAETLTEVRTTLGLVRDRVEKIAEKLNVS